MAEYLTLDDGTKIQILTKENSMTYVVPIGQVYYNRFALCEGSYAEIDLKNPKQKTTTHYGSFIEEKNEEYAQRLQEYIDALKEYDEQTKQGYAPEMPTPPSLPEFKNWKLLKQGESVKLEVIEENKDGYTKNTYTIKNDDFGKCSKTLEESIPVTKAGYDYFIRTGKILPISKIEEKNNKNSGSFLEEKNIILPIIIGSVVLIGIISIILYMNKNKKR